MVGRSASRNSRATASLAATISSSAWTKPAIPTVLTGLWATTHQVGHRAYTDRLPDTAPTLQDRFREGGWRTVSASSRRARRIARCLMR